MAEKNSNSILVPLANVQVYYRYFNDYNLFRICLQQQTRVRMKRVRSARGMSGVSAAVTAK